MNEGDKEQNFIFASSKSDDGSQERLESYKKRICFNQIRLYILDEVSSTHILT